MPFSLRRALCALLLTPVLGLAIPAAAKPSPPPVAADPRVAAQRLAGALDALPPQLGPLLREGASELAAAPQGRVDMLLPALALQVEGGAVLHIGRARLQLGPGQISGTLPGSMALSDSAGNLLGELELGPSSVSGDWQMEAERGSLQLTVNGARFHPAAGAAKADLRFDRLVLSLSLFAIPTSPQPGMPQPGTPPGAQMDAQLSFDLAGLHVDVPGQSAPLHLGKLKGYLALRNLTATGTLAAARAVAEGTAPLGALLGGVDLQLHAEDLQHGTLRLAALDGEGGVTDQPAYRGPGGTAHLMLQGQRGALTDAAGQVSASASLEADLQEMPRQLPFTTVLAELAGRVLSAQPATPPLLATIPAGDTRLILHRAGLERDGLLWRLSGKLERSDKATAIGWSGPLESRLSAVPEGSALPADALARVLPAWVTIDRDAANAAAGRLWLAWAGGTYEALPPADSAQPQPQPQPQSQPQSPPQSPLRTLRVGR